MATVPALFALLGTSAWWLPGRLERLLPRVDVEGEQLTTNQHNAARATHLRSPPPRTLTPTARVAQGSTGRGVGGLVFLRADAAGVLSGPCEPAATGRRLITGYQEARRVLTSAEWSRFAARPPLGRGRVHTALVGKPDPPWPRRPALDVGTGVGRCPRVRRGVTDSAGVVRRGGGGGQREGSGAGEHRAGHGPGGRYLSGTGRSAEAGDAYTCPIC